LIAHSSLIFFLIRALLILLKSIRLKRKETDIDDWQRNKIAKARHKMRTTEVCLITVVLFETDRIAFLISNPLVYLD
jgi:hypothetical protein